MRELDLPRREQLDRGGGAGDGDEIRLDPERAIEPGRDAKKHKALIGPRHRCSPGECHLGRLCGRCATDICKAGRSSTGEKGTSWHARHHDRPPSSDRGDSRSFGARGGKKRLGEDRPLGHAPPAQMFARGSDHGWWSAEISVGVGGHLDRRERVDGSADQTRPTRVGGDCRLHHAMGHEPLRVEDVLRARDAEDDVDLERRGRARRHGVEHAQYRRDTGATRDHEQPAAGLGAVSYTHLDVYKRQRQDWRGPTS